MSDHRPPDTAAWAAINDVFHRAIDRPPAERAAFVASACAGQDDIAREVLSLLASHERVDDFIERPAVSAERLLEAGRVDPRVGRQVGHYEVQRVLGEGGIGIVYLAHDTRLGRPVALKALKVQAAVDASRHASLRHEAQAAAALTHPGVATVYAFEEIDGDVFLASEYVPGETLRTELQQGPLSAATLLETAIGIARPLAAAHAHGVVHRDLKPENVMRMPGGAVKILDFGLALLPAAPLDAGALTVHSSRAGTPAYMSPEQVRGEDLDYRTDVFSFGTLVYELATGTNPFAAADTASSLARILDTTPPSLAQRVPVSSARIAGIDALALVVDRCLRKHPAERYQQTEELTAALVKAQSARDHTASSPRSIWWWQFHQAAASLAYALLLVPLWLMRASVPYHAGLGLFTLGMVGAVTAITLRLHLWFAVRSYPSEWRFQRQRTSGGLMAADGLFVATLLLAGLGVIAAHTEVALVLIGAAVLVLLSFTIIEPATERAAFVRRDEAR